MSTHTLKMNLTYAIGHLRHPACRSQWRGFNSKAHHDPELHGDVNLELADPALNCADRVHTQDPDPLQTLIRERLAVR